jgi:hypothetical protein
MEYPHNPYYNPDKLNLTLFSLEKDDICYDFDTLCFWATEDGRVYTAQDSGCSCPTPFEAYEGFTQDEVLQKLTRVESAASAEVIFENWNKKSYEYDNEKKTNPSKGEEVYRWVKEVLK